MALLRMALLRMALLRMALLRMALLRMALLRMESAASSQRCVNTPRIFLVSGLAHACRPYCLHVTAALPTAVRTPPTVMERARRESTVAPEPAVGSLRDYVRKIPDFPEPGIVFEDITPLLCDAAAYRTAVDALAAPFAGRVDRVVAMEARGFILGAGVALVLDAGFVPMRKLGKLPALTIAEAYDLEYGSATLEMHADALVPTGRVLVVDDVVATGGTARAAVQLVRRCGAEVVGVAALLEIDVPGARSLLEDVALHIVLRD